MQFYIIWMHPFKHFMDYVILSSYCRSMEPTTWLPQLQQMGLLCCLLKQRCLYHRWVPTLYLHHSLFYALQKSLHLKKKRVKIKENGAKASGKSNKGKSFHWSLLDTCRKMSSIFTWANRDKSDVELRPLVKPMLFWERIRGNHERPTHTLEGCVSWMEQPL